MHVDVLTILVASGNIFLSAVLSVLSYLLPRQIGDRDSNIWRNERSRKLRFVNFWISFRGTFHRECMAFLHT